MTINIDGTICHVSCFCYGLALRLRWLSVTQQGAKGFTLADASAIGLLSAFGRAVDVVGTCQRIDSTHTAFTKAAANCTFRPRFFRKESPYVSQYLAGAEDQPLLYPALDQRLRKVFATVAPQQFLQSPYRSDEPVEVRCLMTVHCGLHCWRRETLAAAGRIGDKGGAFPAPLKLSRRRPASPQVAPGS